MAAAEPREPGSGPVDRLRKAGAGIGVIVAAVRLVWAASPLRCAVTFGVQAMASLSLLVQVLLVDQVLSILTEAPGTGRRIGDALLPVAMLTVVSTATTVGLAAANLQNRVLGDLVNREVWRKILDVSFGVDLATYEDPEFHDQAARVQASAGPQTEAVAYGVVLLVGDVLGIIAGAVGLFAVAPLLAPLLLLSGVPLIVVSQVVGRREFAFALRQSEPTRRRHYLEAVLVQRELAKEVRAFALQSRLRARWEQYYDAYLRDTREHVNRRLRMLLAGHLMAALLSGAALVLAVVLVARGSLSVAAAGAALVALRLLGSRVSGATQNVGTIFEASLFLRELAGFYARRPEAGRRAGLARAPEEFEEIRATRISFTYPRAPQPALRGVSITLRRGEVVALVGENGSGKSTLAKLLADLYEPDEGIITWDDVDLRSLDPESVRRRMAIIFQDFARLRLSARDNIALGALDGEADEPAVRRAATQADADDFLAALPHGYDTVLSKEFSGGTDLSLGQWQRVALARAFVRDAPLLILDEPSASLDPRAEYELFERIRTLFADRTVLLVSHRFSTVRQADRIYVLSQGQVLEEGNHEHLMAAQGVYAELFDLQARAYRDDGD
ncbi:ABC transporter ATP-binding protein [Blastococcus sp. SYSU D00820]